MNKSCQFTDYVHVLLLFVFFLIRPLISVGQYSCQDPTPLTVGANCYLNNNFQASDQDLWFTFQADSSYINIAIAISNYMQGTNSETIYLYSGDCQDLQLIGTADKDNPIETSSLHIDDYYYLRINKPSLDFEWIAFNICDAPLLDQDGGVIMTFQGVSSDWCNAPDCVLGTVCQGEPVQFTLSSWRWNHLVAAQIPYQYVFPVVAGLIPVLNSPVYGPSPGPGYGSMQDIFNTQFPSVGDYQLMWNFLPPGTQSYGPFIIHVVASPTLSISNDGPICEGFGDLHLTSTTTGGTSISWSGPGGWSSTEMNPVITSPTSAYAGDYYATIYNENGCSTTQVTTVVILSPNIEYGITISGFKNTCTDTTTYTASVIDPLATYVWSVNPAGCATFSPNPPTGIGLSTVTVTWNSNVPALPGYAVISCSIASDNCIPGVGSLKVYECCAHGAPGVQLINATIDGTNFSYAPGTDFVIEGSLEVTHDFTIQGPNNSNTCHVRMGPMARIFVHPDITFSVIGNVVFDDQTCNIMWDGIYACDPTAKIIFSDDGTYSPSLTYAINGIVSKYGGKLDINSTSFNQNYNSIQVLSYAFTNPNDIKVVSSDFKIDDNANGFVLNHNPYINQQPKDGIYLNHVQGVSIGDHNNQVNSFESLQRGIWSEMSVVTIANAKFSNIPAIPVYSWPPNQAGILSTGSNATSLPCSLIIDGGNPHDVTFDNCLYGVATQRQKTVVDNIDANQCRWAVHLMDIKHPSKVNGCNIHKDATFTTYDYPGTGISVLNAVQTSNMNPDKLFIGYNTIMGMEIGIRCINQNSMYLKDADETVIKQNSITFQQEMSGESRDYRHGIYVEGSDDIQIVENTIQGIYFGTQTPGNDSRGIRISVSPGSFVAYNNLLNLANGVYTNGQLLNTQFPCNYFDECYSGFFFGLGTAMSDQHIYYNGPGGPDYFCPDNYFSNYYNGLESRMRQGNGNLVNTFKWYWDSNLGTNYWLDPWLISIPQNQSHSCYSFVLAPIDIDPSPGCGFFGYGKLAFDENGREYSFGNIARGEIVYDSLIPQNRFYEKNYLYNQLLRNPDILQLGTSSDALYNNVFDSLNSTDPGVIQGVYEGIRLARTDSAIDLNSLISSSDAWMLNRRNANSLYLQTWGVEDYEIPGNDSVDGAAIAMQTPYVAGDAVYTYRVMLNMLDYEFYGTPYNTLVKGDLTIPLKIIPNPTSGNFTLDIPIKENVQCRVEIFSVTGELMLSTSTYKINGQLQYDLSQLPNGCYIVKAMADSGITGHGKICVIH